MLPKNGNRKKDVMDIPIEVSKQTVKEILIKVQDFEVIVHANVQEV